MYGIKNSKIENIYLHHFYNNIYIYLNFHKKLLSNIQIKFVQSNFFFNQKFLFLSLFFKMAKS